MINYRVVILVLLLLAAAGCWTAMPYQPVKVLGTAMLPALKDGDRIVIDKKFDKLERGDIVVFYYPEDPRASYIKRVIGLPSETVEIREGKIFINGKALAEPYLDPQLNLSARSLAEVKLSETSYFVVGDNRDNSSDSRIWGPLERKFIYGKYIKKYFEAN